MPDIITGVAATAGSTQAINQDRRVVEMEDKIFHLEPDKTKLTMLLNKLSRKKVKNPEFSALENERTPTIDRVDESAGYAAGATTITVDNGGYFFEDAVVRVQRTGETFRVTAVSGDDLTVVRSVGSTAAAAMVDNDQLQILGTATEENSDRPGARVNKTETQTNYTQIWRDSFGPSRTLMQSATYGQPEHDRMRFVRGIEHACYIETAFIFGEKAEDVSGAEARRYTGGLDEFISGGSNVYDFGGNVTLAEIFQAAESDFRYGRKTKLLLCSRSVSSNISLVAANAIRATSSEKMFGFKIERLLTPHGEYMVMSHDLLEGDTYGKRAYPLDLDGLGYRFMQDTKLETNIHSPGQDGIQDAYLTEAGLLRVHTRLHGRWDNAS